MWYTHKQYTETICLNDINYTAILNAISFQDNKFSIYTKVTYTMNNFEYIYTYYNI